MEKKEDNMRQKLNLTVENNKVVLEVLFLVWSLM